jgi:hypothetical protein
LPDDKLFTYSIGSMRTFGELALEIVTMGVPMVRGTVTANGRTTAIDRRGHVPKYFDCGMRPRRSG